LVFEIREEGAGEVVEVIEEIMVDKAAEPLGWQIPLKVDVEFGEDWTVPFNLTEMAWNQGGGKWSDRWIKAFPDQYQNYLSCGGEPVGGSAVEQASADPASDPAEPAPAPERVDPSIPAKHVPTREGSAYIFKMKTTVENAQILALVLGWCQGRGMDLLYVRSTDGEDLLGGPVRVAYEEFRIVAEYEGLR